MHLVTLHVNLINIIKLIEILFLNFVVFTCTYIYSTLFYWFYRTYIYKFFHSQGGAPIRERRLKERGGYIIIFVLRGALNNLRQFCDKLFCFS